MGVKNEYHGASHSLVNNQLAVGYAGKKMGGHERWEKKKKKKKEFHKLVLVVVAVPVGILFVVKAIVCGNGNIVSPDIFCGAVSNQNMINGGRL